MLTDDREVSHPSVKTIGAEPGRKRSLPTWGMQRQRRDRVFESARRSSFRNGAIKQKRRSRSRSGQRIRGTW